MKNLFYANESGIGFVVIIGERRKEAHTVESMAYRPTEDELQQEIKAIRDEYRLGNAPVVLFETVAEMVIYYDCPMEPGK